MKNKVVFLTMILLLISWSLLFAETKKTVTIVNYKNAAKDQAGKPIAALDKVVNKFESELEAALSQNDKINLRKRSEMELIMMLKTAAEEDDPTGLLKAFKLSEEEIEKLEAAGADFLIFGNASVLYQMFGGALIYNTILIDIQTRHILAMNVSQPFSLLGLNPQKMETKVPQLTEKLSKLIANYVYMSPTEREDAFRIDQLILEKQGIATSGIALFLGTGTCYTLGLTYFGSTFIANGCSPMGCFLTFAGPVSGSSLIFLGMDGVFKRMRLSDDIERYEKIYQEKHNKPYKSVVKEGE